MSAKTLLRKYLDVGYYFERYREEIFRTRLDPRSHFLSEGLRKGNSPSPLIWEGWYLASNPDAAVQGLSAATHYVLHGWREGRKPNPLFDVSWYLAKYPDVREAGTEPLLHYSSVGWRQGRSPNYLFDSAWYLAQNPEVAAAGTNPLVHFAQSGWRESRAPHLLFDTAWYLEQNADVKAAGMNPLAHFLEHGSKEGRAPHPLFDTAWYLSRNPDVRKAGVEPLAHFLEFGWKEGRAPHPLFDVSWYLAQNTSVQASDVNPLLHFLTDGWKEGHAPHPAFDVSWYLERYPDVAATGQNPLIHYITRGWREERDPNPAFSTRAYLDERPALRRRGVNALIHHLEPGFPGAAGLGGPAMGALQAAGLPAVRPLKLLQVTNSVPRLTLITDTLDDGSLFGGVATALIVASQLANASGRSLRIATRTGFPRAESYYALLDMHGVPRPSAVELYADFDAQRAERYQLDVSSSDVFVTTSWWSTHSLRKSGYTGRVFYLLQEHEPILYQHGEEHLAATRVLSDRTLHFIVNSRLLYEYLATTAGTRHVAESGVFFEPAFPERCFAATPATFAAKDRYRLFFDARPHRPGNLLISGLRLLDEGIRSGLLNTEEIQISFAGAPMEAVEFSTGYQPEMLGKLTLPEYYEFLRSIDLGIALMYAPHPSDSALDVAAGGGVALTSRFPNQVGLDAYSRNIVSFDLMDENASEKCLEEALGLMRDPQARKRNYEESGLSREWAASLSGTVAFFLGKT